MIYSTQLAVGTSSSTTTVVYTVPANSVVVVRSISACNLTSIVDSLNVSRAVSGAAQQIIFRAFNVPVGGFSEFDGRAVLNPGDQISVASGNSGWTYMISGYVLT